MRDYKNKVFRLQGKVQHYDWGGDQFLPNLLKIPNAENKPFAEYWMGAHGKGASLVFGEKDLKFSLDEWIASNPELTMGPEISAIFGRLPFLLKILDVKNMLSIQVHPNKSNAEHAFALENRMKVPLDAASRNYKDDNHKPELMVALGDFWLLHGFKPVPLLKKVLEEVREFNFLIRVFNSGDYQSLYREVMYMRQQQVNNILQPLIDRIMPLYNSGQLSRDSAHFWAARAATIFKDVGSIDRGIFSIYFFNLLFLRNGEAIYQDAGIPHAYLEGQNIEIMANSDNVLRAGLTTKHIDVDELMKHVLFKQTIPEVIQPQNISEGWQVFPTPAPDFELRLLTMAKNEKRILNSNTLEIYFILDGEILIVEEGMKPFLRSKGEAFVSIYQARFSCEAISNVRLIQAGPGMRK
jgi:mannose-6-phosphate isomerase